MKKIITIISIMCLAISHQSTYAQAGSLDINFGTNGKVATSISATGQSFATASALQSDGKIVAAGYAYLGTNIDFALARYNTDGSLDATFNNNGKVTTDIGDTLDFCYAIALQSDGKIVLVGSTDAATKIAVARYNINGSIDSTFSNDGIVTAAVGTVSDEGRAVVIQNDGKILIAVQSFSGTNSDFALIRLNTNGSFDTTFDADGKVITDINGDDLAYDMALQSDGKIIVAGTSNGDFCVARYNTNGNLDNTFDADGKVKTAVTIGDDIATSVAIQNDGKIILAGFSNIGGNVHALVRYNTNGSVDATFNTNGIVLTSNVCLINDIKIQIDGKIVAIGPFAVGPSMDIVVSRYNTNGTLDATFNTNGIVTTDMGFSKDEFAYATNIQSDGKIVVVGHGYNPSNNNFILVRYNAGANPSANNYIALQHFNIYPNPTANLLTIANQNNDYSISILNSVGKEVYTEKCPANKSSVDIHFLAKGNYFLIIQSNSKMYGAPFVKQ
jgi:uncharacterized delta-60 repeat protein